MRFVLDAGALIAIERGGRETAAMLRVAHQERLLVLTSAAVVAQVWRDGGRQAALVRVLAGCDVRPLDDVAARAVGRLLERSRTADVVDAHVAVVAEAGDRVITSDGGDLEHLLQTADVSAAVVVV